MNIGQAYFPILTPQQANPGLSAFQKAMASHLQNMNMKSQMEGNDLRNQQAKALMPYVVPQAQANLQGQQQQNQLAQALMPYQIQGQQNAVQASGLQNQLAKMMMPYQVPSQQADNALKNAQAQYYSQMGAQGGRGMGGVDVQRQNMLLNSVKADNPQLNDSQLNEATNAILSGQTTLADGTKLNPPSKLTQGAMGAWMKSQTTAPLITQNVRANQGESELSVIDNLASQYTAPYATTYFGQSPQQIADSFKNDDASQTQLGQLIAGQALQFEAAQIRNKIAGGEPSITATNDLMKNSGQLINTHWPKLSAKARQTANVTLQDAYNKMLQARNSVGINAAQLSNTGGGYGDKSNNDYSNSMNVPPAVAALMKSRGISQAEAEEVLGAG